MEENRKEKSYLNKNNELQNTKVNNKERKKEKNQKSIRTIISN